MSDSEYSELDLQEGQVIRGLFRVFGTITKIENTPDVISVTLQDEEGKGFIVVRIYEEDPDAQLEHIIDCRVGRDVAATGVALGNTNGIFWLDANEELEIEEFEPEIDDN